MMLRGARFLAVFAVAFAITACEVETETYLSDPSPEQRDDRLVGDWYRSVGTFGVLSIRPDTRRPGVLNVVFLDFETGHARVATFRAWPTRIGGRDFLNLEKLHGLGEWADRTIVHYAIAADGTLSFRWLGEKMIADAISKGQLAGRPKQAGTADPNLPTTITASRPALLAFIAARGPEALFTEGDDAGSHWVRLANKSIDVLDKEKDAPKTEALVTENLLSDPDAAGYDARLVGDRVLSIGPYVGIVSARPEDPVRPAALRLTIAYMVHVPGSKWPLEPVDVLTFRAWRTVIDGRDFLNLEGLYGPHRSVGMKAILGYEIAPDGAFRPRLADSAAIDAAKESGELASGQSRGMIIATREALRAFIAAKGPALWRERYTEYGPYSVLPPTAPKR